MGHIRLGRIPRSKTWSAVFEALDEKELSAERLSQAVALAASDHFSRLKNERGVNRCVWMLIRVLTAARGENFTDQLAALGIQLTETTSTVSFVQAVMRALPISAHKRSTESVFSRFAELSLQRVLTRILTRDTSSLFGSGLSQLQETLRRSSTSQAIGSVFREYFASFLTRSVTYVLDKELSNSVGEGRSIATPREALHLTKEIDRYCYETTKVVQEFAAGWYSKEAWRSKSEFTEASVSRFTAYALEKLRIELDANPQGHFRSTKP